MARKQLHARLRRQWAKDGTYERLGFRRYQWIDSLNVVFLCHICGRAEDGRRLDIDHDHKTLEPRGLLCRGCNMRLRKDMRHDWLRLAADYLEEHGR